MRWVKRCADLFSRFLQVSRWQLAADKLHFAVDTCRFFADISCHFQIIEAFCWVPLGSLGFPWVPLGSLGSNSNSELIPGIEFRSFADDPTEAVRISRIIPSLEGVKGRLTKKQYRKPRFTKKQKVFLPNCLGLSKSVFESRE